MGLVDVCPICGNDLSSRYHDAHWTGRTVPTASETHRGIMVEQVQRVNLRITCRNGRRVSVIVEGKQEIFDNEGLK